MALKNCVSLTASYNLYVYGKAESAWKTCMVRMERCTQKNRCNRDQFPCVIVIITIMIFFKLWHSTTMG